MSDKITIIVDTNQEKEFTSNSDSKSARNPFEKAIQKKASKAVSIEVETIKENIENTCNAIMNALSSVNNEKSKYEIEKASFNLVFDTKGGVSIMSSVSSEINVQTGLTITLQPKRNNHDS